MASNLCLCGDPAPSLVMVGIDAAVGVVAVLALAWVAMIGGMGVQQRIQPRKRAHEAAVGGHDRGG